MLGVLIALPFVPLALAAGYFGMEFIIGWFENRRSRKYLRSIGVDPDNMLEWIRSQYRTDYAHKVGDRRPSLSPEKE